MDDVKINFNESEVNSDNLSGVLISEDAAESLVRCFLPDIVLFFESESGRKEFEEWDRDWDKLKIILGKSPLRVLNLVDFYTLPALVI